MPPGEKIHAQAVLVLRVRDAASRMSVVKRLFSELTPRNILGYPILATLVMLAASTMAVRLYYHIKPAIPRPLRYALRQRLAERRRNACGDIWPILPSAAKQPPGWRGWPQQRRFALLLTHDVESPKGLERVKDIAELEMSMGFRSSFNFIPEGPYAVSRDLRGWLTERGFEVGVHDHRHDGKLYNSRARFLASARRINHYVREWKAAGFRSGFMLHNLDWIPQLDVLYDASTFDTDPFEPQSDAAGTIFPFLVQGANGNTIVELPYTLPQDSTLYLILREKTNQIWKNKLSWIASHGGMALLNVHPDYVCVGNKPSSRYEYPLDLYRDFLNHIRRHYPQGYWHVLPRELATFFREGACSDGLPPNAMALVSTLGTVCSLMA